MTPPPLHTPLQCRPSTLIVAVRKLIQCCISPLIIFWINHFLLSEKLQIEFGQRRYNSVEWSTKSLHCLRHMRMNKVGSKALYSLYTRTHAHCPSDLHSLQLVHSMYMHPHITCMSILQCFQSSCIGAWPWTSDQWRVQNYKGVYSNMHVVNAIII